MARINIEDRLFSDDRFLALVEKTGSAHAALGLVVLAWRLAQKFYLNEMTNRKIPVEEWQKQRLGNLLIECKLAIQNENLISVCGASEQFSWLLQKSEAGKKMSSLKKEALEKARFARWNKNDLTLNGSERSQNGSEALSSSLSSLKKEKKNILLKSDDSSERLFNEFYASFPRKVGKSSGKRIFMRELAKNISIDDLEKAKCRFITHHKTVGTKPKFVPYFSSFMNSWRDYLDDDFGLVQDFSKPKHEQYLGFVPK